MDCRIIILAVVGLLVNELDAKIVDCAPSSSLGKLLKAEISNCPQSNYFCKFHYLTNETVSLQFQTEKSISQVFQRAIGTKGEIRATLPMTEDACADVGLECPLVAAKQYNYSYTLFISPGFPPGKYEVEWSLKDENLHDIVCIRFHAKIEM